VKGSKIHAIVRKQLLYVFQSRITEGKVYNLSCFSVAPSVDTLNKLMRKPIDGMPVVLVQFAKVKIFKGI